MIANKDGGVFAETTGNDVRRAIAPPAAPPEGSEAVAVETAMALTTRWLLDRQQPDGHWLGELEGDTILESEYVLLMAFLGRESEAVCVKACRYLRDLQLPAGGWPIYPGGPAEISASVKAYFALKLVGVPAGDPDMIRAREVVLSMGGAQACNSFTRFYFALLGQISYDDCPYVPPELVLVPSWLNFGLAAMSSWTRTIIVPLMIMSAFKPVRRLPDGQGIAELFRADLPRQPNRWTKNPLSWTNFFVAVDRLMKWTDRWAPESWRRAGVRATHKWMFDHFENSDGLGAIFPPMIYTVVALTCLGYEPGSAPMRWALEQLDDLMIEEDGKVRVQPCVSPVWDTAIATIALADAHIPADDPALIAAAHWLVEREIRTPGDWAVRRPGVEPSGWPFEYRNQFYPDIDDTAMVVMALRKTGCADEPAALSAAKRAANWLLAMQNKDGGWAAFDVDIDNEVLTKVPFADHNAMLDPSCADITARILEMLGTLGYRADHPQVAKGFDYLWRTQEPEGCWYGRWGVNYVYGTWQVLQGLQPFGLDARHPALRKAADWLEAVQQVDGGWGESCASYDDRSLMGQGETTASQTAWAVLGLVAAGRADGEPVRRGIDSLLRTQRADGGWDERPFTGTGFPKVFYLKYHLYRVYFPLMALARFQAATATAPLACRTAALPQPMDV